MDKLRFSALCSVVCGLVFCIPTILFYPGDIKRIIIILCAGLFVGLVATPEFKPKLYKNVAFFQTVSGSLGGALFAMAFYPNVEAVVLGFLLGGLLGWLGPYWLNHINIP